MSKQIITPKFKLANEENFQLILNYRSSLYWQVKDGKLTEESLHAYSKIVYNFMVFLQKKNIKTVDATVELLQEYLDTLKVGAKRKVKIISVVNTFYGYLRKKRIIKRNPMELFDTSELRAEIKTENTSKK